MKTLVLALGNLLRGDDGVGAAVLAALPQSTSIPAHVTLLDGGTPGLETMLLWQGYDCVIIIDAVEMGAAPGVWRQFNLADVTLKPDQLQASMHQAGLAAALTLAAALDRLPPKLIFFGVQPASLKWAPGLSVEVSAAVPQLCTAVAAAWRTPEPVADG